MKILHLSDLHIERRLVPALRRRLEARLSDAPWLVGLYGRVATLCCLKCEG